MKKGPIELKGNMYLIDRANVGDPDDGYLGGIKVGRLHQVLQYKTGVEVQVGAKADRAPSWGRIVGDWIEIVTTFIDWNENLIEVVTNKRNQGLYFTPEESGVKKGHIMRPQNINAVIIRDEDSPTEFPALYIPYCVCLEAGWQVARGAKQTELMELLLTSLDYDGDDGIPFAYGKLETFPGYVAPVAP